MSLVAVVEPIVVVVVDVNGLGVVVLRVRAVVRNVVVEVAVLLVVMVRERGRRVRVVDSGFTEVRAAVIAAAVVETRAAFMVDDVGGRCLVEAGARWDYIHK
jgi:hypothetical protein